jgi:glycosyltransferase involved in cell wall biosynthesis
MIKTSVIIPVYNEEREILNCLESLGNQSLKDFEIIVVDDGSTDKTLVILNNLKKVLQNFVILKQNHQGPGAARNLGAKKAKGKILVFVDADMTFDKNFLKNLIKPIISGKTKGTFSKDERVANWDNIWSKCWNIENNWPEKAMHPKNYPNKQKVFRAILKSEFVKAGGFTPGGYTDDYSLYNKLGYQADAAPKSYFFHKNPDGLKEVFIQAKWAGKREYKFGKLGLFVALLRASFPISLMIGLIKAVVYQNSTFILFKMVYDFGVFIGIMELLITKKATK